MVLCMKKQSQLYKSFKYSLPYYLLLLLPVTYLIVFKYAPIYGVQIAFREFKASLGFFNSPWVGLKYFNMFISAPSFWRIIRNTLLLSVYSLLMGTPLAIVLAIALNECKLRRFKKTIQMITYMPYFISTVVLVTMLSQFTNMQFGIINIGLEALGFPRRDFMGILNAFPHMYVWSGIWQTTGYSAVVYIAALSGINTELYDAATVDGANKLQKILNVDLPGIAPTIIVLFILNTGSILNVGFEKVFLLQNGINLTVSEILSTYVYKLGLKNFNYSFSTMVGLFNSVVSLVLLVICNMVSSKLSDTSLW